MQCNESTGQCDAVYAANGSSCEDGDLCSDADVCIEGECMGSGPLLCDDGDPCTVDSCDSSAGCIHTTEGACDDGDWCTTGDACVDGTCITTGVLTCTNPEECVPIACIPSLGCLGTEDLEFPCDDHNSCTLDTCNPDGTCSHSHTSSLCDDGDGCTTLDTCAAGLCQGTPLNCDDSNPCTLDTCTEGACHANDAPNGFPCDGLGQCISGECIGGGANSSGEGATVGEEPTDELDPETSSEDATGGDLDAADVADMTTSAALPFIHGFDVAADGRMTVAGVDENDAWYACLSASGEIERFEYLHLIPTGYTPIFSKEGTIESFGNAYVARADDTGQSMVSFRMTGPTSAGYIFTGWFEFYLSEACEVTHFNPDQWYGTSVQEYYDLSISNTGMGVSLGAGQANEGPGFIFFRNSTSGSITTTKIGWGEGYCQAKGAHLAVQNDTDIVLATCSRSVSPTDTHPKSLYYQRFNAFGIAQDELTLVDASVDHLAHYDSHIAGIADDGTRYFVFGHKGSKAMKTVVYDPDGAYLGSYELPSLIGANGSVKFGWDHFRYSHAKMESLGGSSMLYPGQQGYESSSSVRGILNLPTTGFVPLETFPTSAPRSRVGLGGTILEMDTTVGIVSVTDSVP